MAQIIARNGEIVLLDNKDLERVIAHKWHVNKGYAESIHVENDRKATLRMHRVVLGLSKGEGIVDHVNGNKLDNRRINLRVVSARENRMNTGPNIRNKLGIKGVVYRPVNSRRPYASFVYRDGKQYYLGSFVTPEEAARAYNSKVLELHGNVAYINKIGG